MNGFFIVMRLITYLFLKECRNIIGGSCTNIGVRTICKNDYFLRSSLKISRQSLNRHFVSSKPSITYTSLFSSNEEHYNKLNNKKERTAAEKKANDSIVSVVHPNGTETIMRLSEAEKYGRNKNMKLVQLESSRGDKVKYKLVKRVEEFDTAKLKKHTNQGKGMKRIILREEIQSHDIQTKINQMLKFIEKDLDVLCLIEKSGKPEKTTEILRVLESSQLNNHFHQKTEAKKGVTLMYKKKITESNDKPEQKTESDVSAK